MSGVGLRPVLIIILVRPFCREVNLKGMDTLRGSMQQAGVQTLTKEGQLTEVTCDKAPLTKHEYVHYIRFKSTHIFTRPLSPFMYLWIFFFVSPTIISFPQENTTRQRTAHCQCMRPETEETYYINYKR